MNRPIFFSSFFSIQLQRIEIFHFAGDRQSKPVASKCVIGPNAALAGQEILPHFLGADAQPADQSNTRYDNPAAHMNNFSCSG